jgi:hypothetical protein
MGRGIDSTPLAMVLCSVLITWPAFGMGSDIRRGPLGGGGLRASPARALGRGGADGGRDAEELRRRKRRE